MIARIAHHMAVVALLMALLTLSMAVSAANATNTGQGAQVVNTHHCDPAPSGGQTCVDTHFVIRDFGLNPNPAGNGSEVSVSSHCITQTNATGATIFSLCERTNSHLLLKWDTVQEFHLSYSRVDVSPEGSFCFTEHFHLANGTIQYDNMTFDDCNGTPLPLGGPPPGG